MSLITTRRMRKSVAQQGIAPCLRLMLWLEDRISGFVDAPPLQPPEMHLLFGVREVLGLND